jgi:hypothetical protein
MPIAADSPTRPWSITEVGMFTTERTFPMTETVPSSTQSPANGSQAVPRQPDPPYLTGLAALDGLTGGLESTMLLAGMHNNVCADLACSLAVGALQRNPGLGAVICPLGMTPSQYRERQIDRVSGLKPFSDEHGELTDAERAHRERAWERFSGDVGRRVWFWESPPSLLVPSRPDPNPFPKAQTLVASVLDERERILRSGAVDRCLVVIGDLFPVQVPYEPYPKGVTGLGWGGEEDRILNSGGGRPCGTSGSVCRAGPTAPATR